ncbi:hypothetical protein OKW45_001759 [Paraburkholderia sp. WSM4175]|uniref:hypothetical protein n=1 Tax=Paraburkholderia sp. WSM4175 TaxID=2991072 RepID=UPI003D1DBF07
MEIHGVGKSKAGRSARIDAIHDARMCLETNPRLLISANAGMTENANITCRPVRFNE